MAFIFNPFTGEIENPPSTKKGNSAYTTYSANSASYATTNYVHTNFLPLSGGSLTGSLSVSSTLTINKNNSITFTDQILKEEDLVYVLNDNNFLKILVNGNIKLLRLYDLNHYWATESNDLIIDEYGNYILL